ncbi:MAG: TadE family protein [Pseudomonadota bacterium]
MARSEPGSAAVEVVIVFPALFLVLGMLLETGVLATRSVMLDRGLDIAARNLRLGYTVVVTQDSIRREVCEASVIIVHCERDLIIELVEMDPATSYPRHQPTCRNRATAIDPVIGFSAGGRNRIMVIRACVIVDPLFPGIGVGLALPRDRTGGYKLISYTAFLNEPS